MRKVSRRAAYAALLAFSCVGCTTTNDVWNAVRLPPPVAPKTQMAALERRIYELVETERETIDPKAKLLTLDSQLTSIARQRSDDMAAKHYMAHMAPDGQTSATLIMAQDASFQGLLGENIAAQHYTPAAGMDVEAYAKRFVDTWVASKSHKNNLAFPDYDRTGIGAAVDGDTVYVTQLFSTDLGLKPPSPPQNNVRAGMQRDVSEFSDPGTAKKSEPRKKYLRARRTN